MKLTLPTDQKKQIRPTKETFENYWIVVVCIKVTAILKFYHFSCTYQLKIYTFAKKSYNVMHQMLHTIPLVKMEYFFIYL